MGVDRKQYIFFLRLPVVSNFGDSSEIHACVRKFSAPPLVTRLLAGAHFRARVCISCVCMWNSFEQCRERLISFVLVVVCIRRLISGQRS